MLRLPFSLHAVLRLVKTVAFVVLVAPWVVLALARAAFVKVDKFVRMLLSVRNALDDHAICQAGHRSGLHGVFECRGCGALFAGYAFAECPVCRESCGFIQCEHCGLAIRNPLL